MSELLKDRVTPARIEALAAHLLVGDRAFPRAAFVDAATRGLEALELKARFDHVADALAATWPGSFAERAARIDAANAAVPIGEAGEGVFTYWPLATFVERHGLDDFEAALRAMHGLTRLATCEFAIRPFLAREPARCFAVLERWALDDDVHVRRLVSEGTRPRLPWGGVLRALVEDPSPSIPLLDQLHRDPELYVRRSVANHLNDLTKDHPERAVAIAARWLAGRERDDGGDVEWVVRRGLRTLLKAGHPGALSLLGYGSAEFRSLRFEPAPATLEFGGALTLTLELEAREAGEWMIDYAVHHRKANGALSAKVFKWTTRSVAAGERVSLEKRHAIRPISTRRYHDGTHRVEVRINGARAAIADFELVGVG